MKKIALLAAIRGMLTIYAQDRGLSVPAKCPSRFEAAVEAARETAT